MRGKRVLGLRRATAFLDRLVGLMGRTRWPQDMGALHFPDCGSVHTFFTFLSLDIVFLDKGRKIIKIIPSTRSWRVYWGPRGTRHCLELPVGGAKRLGFKRGSRLKF